MIKAVSFPETPVNIHQPTRRNRRQPASRSSLREREVSQIMFLLERQARDNYSFSLFRIGNRDFENVARLNNVK
jgi:hypothetical protein